MGSEQFARYPGLKRRSEGAGGDPRLFTVIGVDIDPDKLIAKYKGSKQAGYAEQVVPAVVQKYRTAQPPDATFVDLCRGGIEEPIIVCDLGPDAKGKSWAVVVDGRQRNLAARAINDEKSGKTIEVAAVFRPFKRATAGNDAAFTKVVANARVPRTYSQRAEDAGDLRVRGIVITPPMVEVRTDAEVELLVLLNGCDESVKAAVDEGRILLADVADLAKHPHAEQARRVARKQAGNGKAAKNAAAAPRAKTKPAPVLASWEREVRAGIPDGATDDASMLLLAYADGLRAAQGGAVPEWAAKFHESADAARKAGA